MHAEREVLRADLIMRIPSVKTGTIGLSVNRLQLAVALRNTGLGNSNEESMFQRTKKAAAAALLDLITPALYEVGLASGFAG